MLRLALISDLHFGLPSSPDKPSMNVRDQALELVTAFVRDVSLRDPPDLILTLGDLVHNESPAADLLRYQQLLSAMAQASAPVHHVVGNHDTALVSSSDIVQARKQPLFYSFDIAQHHIVILHTEVFDLEGQGYAVISDTQLAWLAQDLVQTRFATVVAMHHAAFDQDLRTNPWFMQHPDVGMIRQRAELRDIIAQSGNVRAVVNGHLHWHHVGFYKDIPYITVPSLTENLHPEGSSKPTGGWTLVEITEQGVLIRTQQRNGQTTSVVEAGFSKR